MTDEPKDESESSISPIAELQGYDKWPEDISIAFDRALGVATLKWIKTNADSAVADYRAIEAEFLAHFRDDKENAQQVRRIISEQLLRTATARNEPFEACQRYWNELLRLGFYRIERQCFMTWSFVDCCREHGHTDLGLAVIDPLIAELERLRAEPTVTEFAAGYYEDEIGYLQKLRARLEAEEAYACANPNLVSRSQS